MSDDLTDALNEAIASVGGVANLGSTVGVAHSSVVRWRQAGRVPARHVLRIERATGVARHRLRPDLYPPPVGGAADARPGFADAQAPFATEARALGLDPDAIAAKAIQDAIRAEKARRWQEENREAIEAQNAWVEKHGVPLAKYRMF